MSLPPPAPRRHLHTRTIECRGYQREDALFDIEARIVDTKTYAVEEAYRGLREAGAHVHDMEVRVTVDHDMTVRAIDVATSHAPYPPCAEVAPNYKRLVGAKIGAGWRRAIAEAVGGTRGCTHITELLAPVATVAFQTIGSWPKPGENPVADTASKPYFIDGCHSWAADGEVVRRLFPVFYRGR